MTTASPTPYRQIRAQYDSNTITVYQAYSPEIADAAVAAQKLNGSSSFKQTRMTWIKPSWCWMMYRSGYSYKDPRQTRILALKMKHEDFLKILRRARLSHGPSKSDIPNSEEGTGTVVVQWDPERSPEIEKLDYRSIQIGIGGNLSKTWVDEWIVEIEDVTEKAKELKKAVDENVDTAELVKRGLLPEERVYDVPEDVVEILAMNSK
jgi:hypothetical protein